MNSIAIILQWLVEGAVKEALVPKLLERDGAIWWRINGEMVRLTAGASHIGLVVDIA